MHRDHERAFWSSQNEIDGYKATIVKLEGSIAENYNFKILAEQNEMLKGDVEGYRTQIKNLNNTVSTMKIESDILDNYKTKVCRPAREALPDLSMPCLVGAPPQRVR